MGKFTLRIIYISSALIFICCGIADNSETSEGMVVSDTDKSSVENKLDYKLLTKNQFTRWKSKIDDDREL